MKLLTDRLVLEVLSKDDADGIFALRSNPEVLRYTGIARYHSISEANSYIDRILKQENECRVWSITCGGEFLGTICLWNYTADRQGAEVGYDLLPEHWGHGYAPEALKRVVEYAFTESKFKYLFSELRKDNIKSVKVLAKAGFIVTEDFFRDNEAWLKMKLISEN